MSIPDRTSFSTRVGQITARASGSGPCLMMLHGIGGNSGVWGDQFERFSSRFRVIAWDAPGYGGSALPSQDNPTLESYADALIALIDELEVEAPVLLGHSMGGLIAAHVAARHVNRFSRLVLSNCSSGHRSYSPEARAALLANRLDPLAIRAPLQYGRKRAPFVLSSSASASLLERAAQQLAQIQSPGYQMAGAMVSDADVFADLPDIVTHTLVISGREDRVTPSALNRRIADQLRSAEFIDIPNAGHWTFMEQPDVFNQHVLDFLH